jgi:hypothetical protein
LSYTFWLLVQGYPVNINDFKVLLDKRVYRDLEGQWRDLLTRIKWDTIKSALKSVAGLQGRKFKARGPLCSPVSDFCLWARGGCGSPLPCSAIVKIRKTASFLVLLEGLQHMRLLGSEHAQSCQEIQQLLCCQALAPVCKGRGCIEHSLRSASCAACCLS